MQFVRGVNKKTHRVYLTETQIYCTDTSERVYTLFFIGNSVA